MTFIYTVGSARRCPLGDLYVTTPAYGVLTPEVIQDALRRHSGGDWGDVCEEDRHENEASLREGRRLFSVYHAPNGVKFWIITEADRSVTTVLLPDDY